jgi:hypothetical protein
MLHKRNCRNIKNLKHQLELLPYSDSRSYEQLLSNYDLYKLTAKS